MILIRTKRIRWITHTAIFIALLVMLQAATAPLGNMLVTGSIVNLLLIVSVMTGGISSGLIVAGISPVLAKLLGIGPLWVLLPFITAGNIVLVLLWHTIGNRGIGERNHMAYIAALIAAATAKFLVLYIGIVRIAVPVFLGLPEAQAAVVSNMFSVPQLITALIGGVLAMLLYPRLRRVARGGKE
jgi:uncharacterized membrane protein